MHDPKPSILEDPRLARAAPWAVILLVAVIFFLPFLVQGKVFLAADTLGAYLPWRSYSQPGFRPHNMLITDPVNHNWSALYNRQLHQGDLQNWNPYLLTGVPATGATAMSGMPGRNYPLKLLLHSLLPTRVVFGMLLFLHVVLMGCSMYLYLREIGAGARGGLFGAVAYMFNGCAMVWLEFEGLVSSAAFLPLLLLCVERFRGRRRWFYAFAGGVTLGVIALMGHLQYLIYNSLLAGFCLLLLLWRTWRDPERRRDLAAILSCFLLTLGLGGLLAAVDLVPLAEMLSNSWRISRTFTFENFFTSLGRVPFRYYVTLIFPDFFGSPPLGWNIVPSLPTQEYMNYCELGFYVGVPTLFGFVACLAAAKSVQARFYLGLTALFAALMSGTIIYYPFFLLVPGMNKMNPTRILWLFVFVFIVSAALGVKGLEGLSGRRRLGFLAGAGLLFGTALFLAWWGATPGGVAWFNSELFRSERVGAQGLVAEVASLRAFSSPLISRQLLIAAAAAALFAFYAFAPRRTLSVAALAGIVGLLAFDLIGYGRGFNTVVEPKHVYPTTPGIEFLRRQEAPFRVVHDGRSNFLINSLAPFGIEELGGYSSFYPRRVNRLLSAIEYGENAGRARHFDRWVSFRNLASPLFNLMNVRFVLTEPGVRLNLPSLQEVYREEIAIYVNVAALPRAFAVHRHVVAGSEDAALSYLLSPGFNPRGEVVLESAPAAAFVAGTANPAFPPRVSVEQYTPDRVRIAAELAAAGWLVLTDTNFPGWRVFVDGKEAPVLQADYNFRAVALPAGRHAVVFEYRPRSLYWGVALSLLGVALAIGGMAWAGLAGRARAGTTGCAQSSS